MAKVLIIGCGGREHALGWNIAKSNEVSEVLYAPGDKQDFRGIARLITSEKIGLTVVGPETPLAEGLVDYLNSKGHYGVFGPSMEAARLESDKFFSFDLMESLGILQARSVKCYSTKEAMNAIHRLSNEKGVVLKARGLTAGKGVSVCDSKEQALTDILNHALAYGREVLVAERLFGEEFSVFGISDGKNVYPIEMSFQDHKPLLDGDKGPNTGGMGAYGPAPVAPLDVVKEVADNIMVPVVQEMTGRGTLYKGFLYAGLMMTDEGPKVLEFNVRFGDPECQPAMMMLKGSLYEPLCLALEGRLDEVKLEFNPGAACCVVLASRGYPGAYKKGLVIIGLDQAGSIDGVEVFHSGTGLDNGVVVTDGGRVLGVTAYSKDGIVAAQRLAYEAVSKISVEGGFHYRRDIADKALR